MQYDEIGEVSRQIGQRIRKRRKELKMTQEVLAEKLEISTNHLSIIESGSNMRLETLIKMGQVLDMDYTYMITGSSINTTNSEALEILSRLNGKQYEAILEILRSMKSE